MIKYLTAVNDDFGFGGRYWEAMRRKLSLVSRAWRQVTNHGKEIDVNIEEWSFMSLIATLSEEF
jgi:hypothetical protein